MYIQTNTIQNITISVLALIFLLVIIGGYHSGQALAKSGRILANAQTMASGLEYFFQDEERFPTTLEFANRALMLHYFISYPAMDLLSKECPERSFQYESNTIKEYMLYFCLAKPINVYRQGWNRLQLNQ